MELQNEIKITNRISWGSIIAGVITVLAVSLLLTTLGASLGFSLLSPTQDNIVNGADKAVMIWTVIALIISLASGGFVAGRLAGADGLIHGFLIWGTTLLVATVLGFSAVGGLIKLTGSAVSSVASGAGTVVSGAGKAVANTADFSKEMFDKLGVNTNIDMSDTNQDVINALKKSNIPELQPQYLHDQLQQAGNDVMDAGKSIATHPENSDQIISQLTDKLKSHTETISKSVNRDDVKNALAQNTSMTQEQADQAVNNFIQARDKAVQQANESIDQLQTKVNQAKAQYAQFKQEAKQKADAAAKAAAKISLWSFVALLLGAIVSSVAGMWGVNTLPNGKRIKA
ncbi:CAP-Gly protein [Rosenbergiella sp. S61]|uniref:CAP-Gly protein n=1 Tax=Rosenbergiella gaditana TaxID=2726987 RepID=A0ABS5SV21_9GAMM|nr:TIGR04086 family membrane protein [Rosenbergiella gaditana]MBT0723288.1 CAP-Gly protein [Rosenbergiella gaditana]